MRYIRKTVPTLKSHMAAFRIDRFTALLLAIGMLGAALILLRQINYGPGVGADSLLYISAAWNLAEGNGFVNYWGEPYIDAAPLFPMAMAFLALLGLDVVDAAAYINAAAFGITAFTTALWLRSRIQSRPLVAWAGCACILSTALARSASGVMTDALFVSFTILSLFALDRFLDTRQRSLLLMAAACAALACLTRYIGVTVVASCLILLLMQRNMTFSSKAKNIAVFSVIAITPIGIWMLRNLLTLGELTGKVYPTDFSLVSSLHTTVSAFGRWAFGNRGLGLFDIALGKVFGISIIEGPTIAGVVAMAAILLTLAVGVGYLLWLLNRKGEISAKWNMWAVPVVFIAVYIAFIAVILPLTDVDIPVRYLAPIYPPILVATTLVINEFLGYAKRRRPLEEMPFLRRWNTGFIKKTPLSLAMLVLAFLLSLWLSQQVVVKYMDIRWYMDNGILWYTSKRWAESDTVRYLISYPVDGQIFSNNHSVENYLYAKSSEYRNSHMQVWYAGVEDEYTYEYIYYVWFTDDGDLPEMLRARETEVVAELNDGVILKGVGKTEPLDEAALLRAGLPKDAQPVIRSVFDVYLDEITNRLVYAKTQCSDADIYTPFSLHIYPADTADLYENRFTFNNFDFVFRDENRFTFNDFDFVLHDDNRIMDGGLCLVWRDLPDYEIDKITTGQLISSPNVWIHIWKRGFSPREIE